MIISYNVIINFGYLLLEKYENDKCLKGVLMVENDFHIFEKNRAFEKTIEKKDQSKLSISRN